MTKKTTCFTVTESPKQNESSAIVFLEAELADRDTIINFLLFKLMQAKNRHAALLAENRNLRSQVGNRVVKGKSHSIKDRLKGLEVDHDA